MTKPTLVTCFFDIGRGSWNKGPAYLTRTTDTYFERFERLLKLDNDIVVFTSRDLEERFRPYQYKYPGLTVIGFEDWRRDIWPEFFEPIKKIQTDPNYISMLQQPWNPEYWNVDYVMVNMLKAYFVNYAFELGIAKSELISWIDFGYAREDDDVPNSSWNCNFDASKIHFFSIKKYCPPKMDIMNIIATNDVWITGCHIIAGKERWRDLLTLVYSNLAMLIKNNLIDDDQSILYACYCARPELFDIHYINSNDWFCIFRKFHHG